MTTKLAREDGTHWSDLKEMGRSPAHYRTAVLRARRFDPRYAHGSLFHAVTLGTEYIVYEGERRGNAWKDFATANEGKLIATEKELARVIPMAKAVLEHPHAMPLLRASHREFYGQVHVFGRKCAFTVDAYDEKTGLLTELKSTKFARPDWLAKECRRRKYHAQLAWYRDMLAALGKPVNGCRIVAVESSPPHPVVVLRLTPELLAQGESLNGIWLNELQTCEENDRWPGYADEPIDLDVELAGETDLDLIFGDEDTEARGAA
jgi:hypothetical protein